MKMRLPPDWPASPISRCRFFDSNPFRRRCASALGDDVSMLQCSQSCHAPSCALNTAFCARREADDLLPYPHVIVVCYDGMSFVTSVAFTPLVPDACARCCPPLVGPSAEAVLLAVKRASRREPRSSQPRATLSLLFWASGCRRLGHPHTRTGGTQAPRVKNASGAFDKKREVAASDPWSPVGLCRAAINTTNFRRSEGVDRHRRYTTHPHSRSVFSLGCGVDSMTQPTEGDRTGAQCLLKARPGKSFSHLA